MRKIHERFKMEASINYNRKSLWIIGDYSEPNETSKMELSAKILDCIQPLTVAKHFIWGVLQGHEYVSHEAKQNHGALSLFPQKIRTANFFYF